ncbi:short-chain fatty acyl-CoA regulator family protein, partial [Aquabacterium sp.]|uniref:short-chain fatty acyl-CoA regulator family protein n=1 Tax=Aquabacterium sp. TaxID=1872578 RepID=UPI002CBA6574
MRKTFMGVRLKTLREQQGLTQAALAQRLQLSPSYLNQLENNQRPLSVAVLLRLQSALGVDLQYFSEDEEARFIAQLQEVVAEVPGGVPQAELQAVAQQMPALAQVLVRLHRRARAAEERLATVAEGLGERGDELLHTAPQAHEEVRDFFYAHSNHMPALDARAEALHQQLMGAPAASAARHAQPGRGPLDDSTGRTPARELAHRLQQHLLQAHGVTLRLRAGAATPAGEPALLRQFDPQQRLLSIADSVEPGQLAFQLATQLAHLEAAETIEQLARQADFSSDESRALARIGLANYFAGALVLPYQRFLMAAEELRYDIELLAQRFGVSFETACHRLSSLQRSGARGVPFFFVRVDRAGNISKRQSATDFHFSRTGGTCPLWNVYEAFAQPGKVLTQLARMPDGRTYLWIARCVTRQSGGYGSPVRSFAVGLGCDIRHADRLVYA